MITNFLKRNKIVRVIGEISLKEGTPQRGLIVVDLPFKLLRTNDFVFTIAHLPFKIEKEAFIARAMEGLARSTPETTVAVARKALVPPRGA